jgi:2Fe-2S ferredoxin
MCAKARSSVAPADDDEEDQLDDAWGVDAAFAPGLLREIGRGPLVVELPRFTRNHAREA